MSEPIRPRWSVTVKPDNGLVHYGSGMPGSLCGVFVKPRREVSGYPEVTCPECLKEIRKRP